MSNFDKEFQQIIKELESEIVDPNDLEIAKQKLYRLYKYVFNYDANIKILIENQKKMNKEIERIKKTILNIEEDIYDESNYDFMDEDDFQEDKMHDNDYEFEITCPYCNYNFIADNSYVNKVQIPCPNCKKIIDLDWSSTINDLNDADEESIEQNTTDSNNNSSNNFEYSDQEDNNMILEDSSENIEYMPNNQTNQINKNESNIVNSTNGANTTISNNAISNNEIANTKNRNNNETNNEQTQSVNKKTKSKTNTNQRSSKKETLKNNNEIQNNEDDM